jgi:hypothetical protein
MGYVHLATCWVLASNGWGQAWFGEKQIAHVLNKDVIIFTFAMFQHG